VGAESLWCILEGQTMIRLARPVSKALRLPLRSWAWDAPGWWLRENGVDRITTAFAVREFGAVLRESASFGAASWAMAERYSKLYGVRAVPVIPGLDGRLARTASGAFHDEGRLVIGMAGQLYASQEWEALMRALDAAGWKLSGRDVTVRLMGARASLSAPGYRRIEYLGWGSQAETVAAMAGADILYCPYWFAPEYEEEARVGFPSKLTTYLAAGRPVLFHGPAYASPARFLEENGAALHCDSNEPRTVLSALERLAGDAGLREGLAERGGRAFADHLTLGKTRERFAGFLGVSPDDLERPAGT
ncbi:MAG TPA: glycosyltransferase, partial [Candidatus Deferrimicrobiaceae bacterium]